MLAGSDDAMQNILQKGHDQLLAQQLKILEMFAYKNDLKCTADPYRLHDRPFTNYCTYDEYVQIVKREKQPQTPTRRSTRSTPQPSPSKQQDKGDAKDKNKNEKDTNKVKGKGGGEDKGKGKEDGEVKDKDKEDGSEMGNTSSNNPFSMEAVHHACVYSH